MRINTNIASMTAQEAATNTNKNISSSLEKLGSGLAINKAADDASGLSIADKLRTQASSLKQGINNANSASALIQIADKAMSEQSNILDIVKTKLIQASTSTTSTEGRESIRKDISKLLEQFDAIASQTNYNGTTLLQKSATDTAKQDDLEFQLGESDSFDVTMVQSKASNTSNLGGGSEAFGASSISATVTTATITAANAVAGVGFGDDKTATHNNIGTNGTQQLSTTGGISLASVAITAAGVEAASTANGIDVTLSGEIGKIAVGGNAVLDFSSESQSLKDFAKNLDATANFDYDEVKEQLKLTGAQSLDFGNLEVSSLRVNDDGSVTGNSALASLEINKGGRSDANSVALDSTFSITNNVASRLAENGATDYGLSGQLNVAMMNPGTQTMTGGQLMSGLKSLGEGDLTADVANSFMSTIDEAMTQLNANRSDFGSTQNQLESSIRNMQTTQTNLKAAESVIRDVDYASESANFNKQNIIAQAGTYAMSQANAMQQNVMRLLQ